MVLEQIRKRMNYRVEYYHDTPTVLYNSHRSIVPVIWQASREKLFDIPINLVSFDMHTDTLEPSKKVLDFINDDLKKKPDLEEIFRLTDFYLHPINDNWLKTLMELNLVSDAVIIGCKHDPNSINNKYTDQQGNIHKLFSIPCLNGAFNYQGNLVDIPRIQELRPIWEILNWYVSKGKFTMGIDPILLDFDLDYFSFQWRSIQKAWLPEFFQNEFLDYSTYSGQYWSGQLFVQEIIKRSPLITIAREPLCCGGEQESTKILVEINNILFDGKLDI